MLRLSVRTVNTLPRPLARSTISARMASATSEESILMHGSRSKSLLVRCGLGVTIAGLLVGIIASPAAAQTPRKKSDGPRVVLTGRVEVKDNERTDTVVIF